MADKKLTVDDWIKGAFRALTSGGPPSVRVEPLARSLKVSKGSFYWHFKDLADLHTKMIAHWEKRAVADIIDDVSTSDTSPRDMLQQLMEIAISDLDVPYGGPLVETAIRAWAQQSAMVAQAQERVDATRTAFLARLLRADDCARPEHWAHLIYAVHIGSAHMPVAQRQEMTRGLLKLYDTDQSGKAG